jgi:hypothetical protein
MNLLYVCLRYLVNAITLIYSVISFRTLSFTDQDEFLCPVCTRITFTFKGLLVCQFFFLGICIFTCNSILFV